MRSSHCAVPLCVRPCCAAARRPSDERTRRRPRHGRRRRPEWPHWRAGRRLGLGQRSTSRRAAECVG
jgi:hypothetical protein